MDQRAARRLTTRRDFDYVLLAFAAAMYLAASCLSWLHFTHGPPAQRVNIRWAAATSVSGRADIERDRGLVAGVRLRDRTWQYFLRNRSRDDIKRLVTDPRVEDTFHLDREAFRVQVDRSALSPDARAWLELDLSGYASLALAFVATFMTLWSRRTLAAVIRGTTGWFRRSLLSRHRHNAASFLLATLVFGAVFHQFITQQQGHRINDFQTHLDYAASIRSADDIRSPHFLFQLLVIAINKALGLGWTGSTVVLLSASYGVMAVLLLGKVRRLVPLASAYHAQAIVIALLIASHVFLFTMPWRNLYWGYFVPVMYTNPTQQLNKLFALWIYLHYSARVLESKKPSLWRAPSLAALCVLSALAKPSFLIAFLPASGLIAVRDLLTSRWKHFAVFVAGIAVPSVAVLIWQARAANEGAGFSIAFAPFAVFDAAQTAYKLPLSLAFPIAVLFVAFRTEAQQHRLHFSWLFTTLALAYTLGLSETGPTLVAGNFAWTGQTAVFLAYVESTLFLLTLPPGTPGRRIAWTVFAVHVACGAFWYASVFFPRQDTWL